MRKFSHLEVFKTTLDVVYITSMMYVFGFVVTTIVQQY